MKADIHPEYKFVVVRDVTNGFDDNAGAGRLDRSERR